MISLRLRCTTHLSPRQAGTVQVSAQLGSSRAPHPQPCRGPRALVGLEGCPAMFSAGSESWSEGAEMLSIGEVDAADVQVSTESCNTSQLHTSPACPSAFCRFWSSSLSIAVLQLWVPCVPHVVHICDSSDLLL